MLDIISKGGYVIALIIACSLVACAVIIERWLYYRAVDREATVIMSQIRKEDKFGEFASYNSVFGKMWHAGKKNCSQGKKAVESVIEETVQAELPCLEQHLYILVTIATISPLLGLLGTVMGMIKTFHAASLSGVGDPHMLAEGISEALYNTAGGLMVTIPCVIANNRYRSRVERFLHLAESYGGEMARLLAGRGEKSEN